MYSQKNKKYFGVYFFLVDFARTVIHLGIQNSNGLTHKKTAFDNRQDFIPWHLGLLALCEENVPQHHQAQVLFYSQLQRTFLFLLFVVNDAYQRGHRVLVGSRQHIEVKALLHWSRAKIFKKKNSGKAQNKFSYAELHVESESEVKNWKKVFLRKIFVKNRYFWVNPNR